MRTVDRAIQPVAHKTVLGCPPANITIHTVQVKTSAGSCKPSIKLIFRWQLTGKSNQPTGAGLPIQGGRWTFKHLYAVKAGGIGLGGCVAIGATLFLQTIQKGGNGKTAQGKQVITGGSRPTLVWQHPGHITDGLIKT